MRFPRINAPPEVVLAFKLAPNAIIVSLAMMMSAVTGVLRSPNRPRLCAIPLKRSRALRVVATGAPIRSARRRMAACDRESILPRPAESRGVALPPKLQLRHPYPDRPEAATVGCSTCLKRLFPYSISSHWISREMLRATGRRSLRVRRQAASKSSIAVCEERTCSKPAPVAMTMSRCEIFCAASRSRTGVSAQMSNKGV